MPDMAALLAAAAQMQEQILAAQDELACVQVRGSAGGGLVSATVTATGELVGLEISPTALDPEDTEMLADLVLAAVRDANRAAAAVTAATMGPFTTGMDGFGAGIMADLGLGDGAFGAGVPGERILGGSPFQLPPGH
jgi:DNA-binding YbaB/EbfC family protein